MGTALFALGYIVFSSYVALWGSRRLALTFLAAMAGSYFALLAAKGALPLMFVAWLLLVLPCTSTETAEGLVVESRAGTRTAFSHGTVLWPSDMSIDLAVADADRRMYRGKGAE